MVAYLVFALLLGPRFSTFAVGLRTCYLLIAASALGVGVGLRVSRRRGWLSERALHALALPVR